jgi:hypothetical protein
MNTKKIALALVAGTALLAAAPAFADGWRGHPRHPRHYYYRAPVVVYYPARAVVVMPPAYTYAPPPRVVYPAPVFYGNVPVAPGVQVQFRARL